MVHPYFMITNRNVKADGLGRKLAPELSYFECPAGADPLAFANWTKFRGDRAFKARLIEITGTFPCLADHANSQQKHLSLYVHGYNTDWTEAIGRYALIKETIFDANDLGLAIAFTWPSDGSVAGYLPDREDARDGAGQVAVMLEALHTHLIAQQRRAADTQDPEQFCRAKVSIIAHSMGGYVMQKGLAIAAKRLNSPQLVSLVHQLVLVSADIDNDLFQTDKAPDSDGSLMSNLCYRIGGLYTGLDETLGASAGLKHFGQRRLGRSGLADRNRVWDNVFDYDISRFVKGRPNIHAAAFESPECRKLIENILRGVDRGHLDA
jgi:esterase/lipase superfamily enzyme